MVSACLFVIFSNNAGNKGRGDDIVYLKDPRSLLYFLSMFGACLDVEFQGDAWFGGVLSAPRSVGFGLRVFVVVFF